MMSNNLIKISAELLLMPFMNRLGTIAENQKTVSCSVLENEIEVIGDKIRSIVHRLESERKKLESEIEALQNPWVSVRVKLPETDARVICIDEDNYVYVVYFDKELFKGWRVRHWMHIPAIDGDGK